MTREQIEYYNYIMQRMENNGGDVAAALVWCSNHFYELSDNQHNAIYKLSTKERNQVIHELTMI